MPSIPEFVLKYYNAVYIYGKDSSTGVPSVGGFTWKSYANLINIRCVLTHFGNGRWKMCYSGRLWLDLDVVQTKSDWVPKEKKTDIM